MDIHTILNNLVSNRYMTDFDYLNHELSFRTVFYYSGYSYRCCICGFIHEYIDYISKDGNIDEVMYEKVKQCIIDGECPHVKEVSLEYVTETGIYGVHIAAAVGTKQILTGPQNQFRIRFGKLFGLDPCMLAMFKEQHSMLSMPHMLHFTNTGLCRHLYASRSSMNPSILQLEKISVLEFCVRKRNIKLLKSYIQLNGLDHGVAEALHLTLKHSLPDMQEVLLGDRTWFRYYDNLWTTRLCCELAVVYDQPRMLDKLLKYLHSVSYETDNATNMFIKTCHALPREQCLNILSTYGINELSPMSLSEKVNILLHLLGKFYDALKDEIITLLKAIPNLKEILNCISGKIKWTYLHKYVDKQVRNPESLNAILEMGSNVNVIDANGQTPFMWLLTRKHTFRLADRHAAELFIFENPEAHLHQSAILHALKIDIQLFTREVNERTNTYIADSQYHMLFGFEEEENYAFNFMAPLLIECGFPVPSEVAKSVDTWKAILHPVVYTYMRRYLHTPRSLKACCRDTLRRYYIGRQIHMFVQKSVIPSSLEDYILLKSLLRLISKR